MNFCWYDIYSLEKFSQKMSWIFIQSLSSCTSKCTHILHNTEAISNQIEELSTEITEMLAILNKNVPPSPPFPPSIPLITLPFHDTSNSGTDFLFFLTLFRLVTVSSVFFCHCGKREFIVV